MLSGALCHRAPFGYASPMTHDATAARIAAIIAALDLDILAWDISDAIAKSEQAGLDTFAMDEIKAELPAFLAGCLRRVETADADPMARFADAPRAKSHGGFIHTCNGDVLSGLPFGRKDPEHCARCYEMVNGAPAREDHVARRRNPAAEDAARAAEIREHDCTASRCGLVCTFGQW